MYKLYSKIVHYFAICFYFRGVFVKIKGVPMHPECFKCVKCGVGLKNQGILFMYLFIYIL